MEKYCYKVLGAEVRDDPQYISFDQCQQDCNKLGGKLASIHSEAENTLIWQNLGNIYHGPPFRKTDYVDYLQKPSWIFFCIFFAIHSSNRHEKHSQMLKTLFWVFQHSRNTDWCALRGVGMNSKHFFTYNLNLPMKNMFFQFLSTPLRKHNHTITQSNMYLVKNHEFICSELFYL